MTTNGILLSDKLGKLKRAGIDRLNISLNTFNRDRYIQLAGVDMLDQVLASIRAAAHVFKFPVKINTVIIKGINDDEVEDFADFALKNNISVRFIEYFPINSNKVNFKLVPNIIIKERIEKRFGRLVPDSIIGRGPAVNFGIANTGGKIGFISTQTENFCRDCNRLRLSADGRLYPCLFSPQSISIADMMRKGLKEEIIYQHLDQLMYSKKNYSKYEIREHEFAMSNIGG